MKVKERRVAIYSRASTTEQHTELQTNELEEYAAQRGWTVHRTYIDEAVSGTKQNRPALDALMAEAQQKKFDVVLVWKFDRFARSLSQLVSALELFKALSIDFVSCTEAVDTTVPIGQFVFHVFGAIAQFERELIRERTIAGVREARRRGKKLGRPSAAPLPPEQMQCIRRERSENKVSLRKLSRQHGIPLWRIHSICREEEQHNV
jgi:DNA invertase Pin-like site-specific DNA recombinase